MIVVTTGTNEQPFDRLIRAAARLRFDEPLLVQHGSSQEPRASGEWHAYMPFERLADAMSSARVVVCHAGVGSIMLARRCGKVPIVVPRRVALHEAVDDHQLHLARRLDGLGVVRLVEDDLRLQEAIDAHGRSRGAFVSDRGETSTGELAIELRTYFGKRAALTDRSSRHPGSGDPGISFGGVGA